MMGRKGTNHFSVQIRVSFLRITECLLLGYATHVIHRLGPRSRQEGLEQVLSRSILELGCELSLFS